MGMIMIALFMHVVLSLDFRATTDIENAFRKIKIKILLPDLMFHEYTVLIVLLIAYYHRRPLAVPAAVSLT